MFHYHLIHFTILIQHIFSTDALSHVLSFHSTITRKHCAHSVCHSSNHRHVTLSNSLERKRTSIASLCHPQTAGPNSNAKRRGGKHGCRLNTSLTTFSSDDEGSKMTKREKYLKEPLRKAIQKFKARPGTYLLIPCVAALVGWLTNWLAVQMIFYPIRFVGLPIYRVPEVPLGLLGWQGIVPCKTRPMAESMVNMVTTQLINVQEVFRRLDPNKIAELMAPEIPKIGQGIVDDIVPQKVRWLASLPSAAFMGLSGKTREVIAHMNHEFLKGFTIAMQDNIDSILNVRNCVVNQMIEDRTVLGDLFRKCGQKELDFLTNSGLWFGFLLGLIQMVVALFWENPWSLSIGGGIVGLATNWLALKWIFEPVNPTKFGPFILQGQFLRRQKEVAIEFSDFFANKILSSENIWNSILTDPDTTPAFHKLFTDHLVKFVTAVSGGLRIMPEHEVIKMSAMRAIEKLPQHIGVLHPFVDKKLKLQETLRVSMEGMSSAQFERVLHPIFEEDELTLILAGAALGFAAGLVQQGLETGKIKAPSPREAWSFLCATTSSIRHFSPRKAAVCGFRATRASIGNIVNMKRKRKHTSNNDAHGKESDSVSS